MRRLEISRPRSKTLIDSIKAGTHDQTLLGVTGSGKVFTMANIIQKLDRPALVLAHNKTLARSFLQEFKEYFPENAITTCFVL